MHTSPANSEDPHTLRAARRHQTELRALANALSSPLAHDINNNLTVGATCADLLQPGAVPNSEQAELVKDIRESFQRLIAVARALSHVGRSAGLHAKTERLDLAKVLREELAAEQSGEPILRSCTIDMDAPATLPATVDRELLVLAVHNLLLNAAESDAGPRHIQLKATRDPAALCLEVHDDGPGIPEEQRLRVFEPFHTTREGHLGLGLIAVQALARQYRGRFEADRSPLGGACIRIVLPMQSP